MSKLLVVDDEQSICWGITRLGESIGHEVLTASTAEEALEAVTHARPDVIVLDVRLPGMDGLTAMGRIREHVGDVPIIVMTAYGDLETAVQAVRNGAFEYIVKPFDLSKVEQAIARAIASDEIPPLRDRPDDIRELAENFLAEASDRPSGPRAVLASETSEELSRRKWHGNVRELRNAVEHALLVARGGVIQPEHLPAPAWPPARRRAGCRWSSKSAGRSIAGPRRSYRRRRPMVISTTNSSNWPNPRCFEPHSITTAANVRQRPDSWGCIVRR